MSRLVIFEGEEQRAEHELARAVVGLGRHPQNDIVLNDRTLSRFHARIERRDDSFVVIDLGAQNGVHVNGERISGETLLNSGDRIELGRYTAVFQTSRPVQKKQAAPREPVGKAKANQAVPDLDLDLDIDIGGGLDDLDMTVEPSQVDHVAPKPMLVLLFNDVEVSRHPIHSEGLTIGRSKQCDVVISLLGLSRKHTRVVVTDDGVAVEDLGSQNGTWVNNERVEGLHVLQHGDILNFYDYNVLFLEDGDVDVGVPGAEGADQDLDADDLFPHEAKAAPKTAVARAAFKAVDPEGDETALGRPRRSGRHRTDDGLDLDDLGDGSFLGDEFDEGASKVRPNSPSKEGRRPVAQTPARAAKDAGNRTALYEPEPQLSRSSGDEDLEADVAFSAAAVATNGGHGTGDRTSVGLELHGEGGDWPTDDELESAMMVAESTSATLEITMRGKLYTQVPVNLPVMRLGCDPRCEISLPRSSGLRPWHVTFAQVGANILAVRSNQAARMELDGREVASALLSSGHTLTVGKVALLVRARR